MLDAARRLFAEEGYAATTVRMIAVAAGLSPAGVFTTFADKADILHHVRMAQNAVVREALAQAAREGEGTAVERACAFVRDAYRLEWPDRALVLAWIGESQTWSPETERDCNDQHVDLFAALDEVLTQGVARGELRPDLDVSLARELIYGVYIGNWRRAWHAGWDPERTAGYVQDKIRLLFGGFAA